jgi:membrane-associated phospholipid phosphatase
MPFRAATLATALAAASLSGLGAQGWKATAFSYALDPIKDSAWVAGDLALVGASLYLDSIKSADPSTLDASSLSAIDLHTTTHSEGLNSLADGLVIGAALVPAVVLPGMGTNEMLATGLMYAETLGLAYGLNSTIKSLVVRYRPYAYSNPAPSDIGSSDIAGSFPSRHATLAFASAAFAASVFDATHPDSKYRGLIWAGGFGLATGIAALRVISGDHFLSDVAAGAALGSLVGFGLPYLHRTFGISGSSGGKSALSLETSGLGLSLTLKL